MICVGVVFSFSCKSPQTYTGKPAKNQGAGENDLLEVNEVVYHNNDSSSQVYLEIKNQNLLYKYSDTSASPYAHIRLRYALFHEKDGKNHIDSASYVIFDKAEEEILVAKSIYSAFSIPAKQGENYWLKLLVIDQNKHIQYNKEIPIMKQSRFGSQNFLLTQHGKLVFKNYFTAVDTIEVSLNSPLYFSAEVDCFTREFPIALPPFSNKASPATDPKPDSIVKLPVNGSKFSLPLAKRGFYFIKINSQSSEGLGVFSFNSAFPNISSSEEMIYCTRYIMSKEEFTSCLDAENKKKAIDKFWLELGGSNERAKELLRRYYARVKDANLNYCEFAEGWKSDRGMIYIVFGPPNTILEKDDEEVWIYGSPVNQSTTTFIFKKIESVYSKNVFVLDRSQFYKASWSNAVDMWRQGIFYEGKQ